MERAAQRIGLVNLLALVAVGGSASFLASFSRSLSAQASLVFFGLGFLVALMSYFQMRLEEAERLEKLEFEELNKAKGSASLFNITDADIFPAQRSREQFERIFVPIFGILLFLLQGAAAYLLGAKLLQAGPAVVVQPTLALSIYALFALILFLLGKYSSSRSRLENIRLLRPGSSYVLLNSYVCFLATAAIAGREFGFPNLDLYLARAFAVIIALGSVESLVNLVLEIYRPRVKGRAARPLYESRVVGLLAQPEGLVTTAAHAMDYQFGFKVSETWFYRFLERALAWIILLQLAAFWISSTVVFISPGEQAVLERLGRAVESRGIMEPGLHFKFPWPIDRVWRSRTREIQRFSVGFIPDPSRAGVKTILWTVQHTAEEFQMLVASRNTNATQGAESPSIAGVGTVDLLNVSVPVQFVVNNLHDWTYNHYQPANLLERLATREVARYLIGVDLTNIVSSGRMQAAQELQSRIQKSADDLQLGVSIVFVGLQDIHPPVTVAPSFEAVNAALQEKESIIFLAEGYRATKTNKAAADAHKKVNEAKSYAARRVAEGQAAAVVFTNQLAAFNANPELYQNRLLLRAYVAGATNSRQYVLLLSNRTEIIQMNLEDKVRSDLYDVPLPSSVTGAKINQ